MQKQQKYKFLVLIFERAYKIYNYLERREG